MPVILSMHPNTMNHIKSGGYSLDANIILHEPFGMFDYIKLQKSAFCCLSDSGTIHEDAAILGITAVNIREVQERPEVYETGNVVMSGVTSKGIINTVELVRAQLSNGIAFDNPYRGNTNCSDKVVRLIMSLHEVIRKKKYGKS